MRVILLLLFVCAIGLAQSSTYPPGVCLANGSGGNWSNISAEGDSLTAGNEDITNPTSYPTFLQQVTNQTVYNNGTSGYTSTQIAASVIAATTRYPYYHVIWAGTNNPSPSSTVLADIASMVAVFPALSRYLTISLENGDNSQSGSTTYTQIIAANAALAAAYPNNYLDIRSYLVSLYNSGNAQDVIDHGHDVPPSSLRATRTKGTLNGAIADTVSCAIPLTVVTGVTPQTSWSLIVDSEWILISGYSAGAVSACTRGYYGTTAATHSNAAAFTVLDSVHLNGPGYQYVANKIAAWISAVDIGVSVQAPGGALTGALIAPAGTTSQPPIVAPPGVAPTGTNLVAGASWMLSTGGFWQRYDGTTTRQAVELLPGTAAGTTNTASISPTTLITPTSTGYYTVRYSIWTHAAGSGGTVTFSATANEGLRTITATSASVDLTSTASIQTGTFTLKVLTGTALQWSTTVASSAGSPTYAYFVSAEQVH